MMATKGNVSFDVSSQIEEIFAAEADDDAAATASKPTAAESEDDMFGDSFANISDIDNMVEAHGKKLQVGLTKILLAMCSMPQYTCIILYRRMSRQFRGRRWWTGRVPRRRISRLARRSSC